MVDWLMISAGLWLLYKLDVLMKPLFSEMNLSKFLNILDGIPERTGQIIIMSANRPDTLDPALRRPGKMDLNINFKKATFKVFCKLVANYFKTNLEDIVELYGKNSNKIAGMLTPAEIYEKCNATSEVGELLIN